eukprot:95198-Chlamydomonas_euryale.AAC.7
MIDKICPRPTPFMERQTHHTVTLRLETAAVVCNGCSCTSRHVPWLYGNRAPVEPDGRHNAHQAACTRSDWCPASAPT